MFGPYQWTLQNEQNRAHSSREQTARTQGIRVILLPSWRSVTFIRGARQYTRDHNTVTHSTGSVTMRTVVVTLIYSAAFQWR
jgi:hypothetical protein